MFIYSLHSCSSWQYGGDDYVDEVNCHKVAEYGDLDAQVEIDGGDGGDDDLEHEDQLSGKLQWRGVNRPLWHLQS